MTVQYLIWPLAWYSMYKFQIYSMMNVQIFVTALQLHKEILIDYDRGEYEKGKFDMAHLFDSIEHRIIV